MTLRKPLRYKQISRLTTAFLVIVFLASVIWIYLDNGTPAVLSGSAHAVDGDTLRIGNARLRVLGMDAPEFLQTCGDAGGNSWACGQQARDALAVLTATQEVHCTVRDRDQYGRFLADCRSGEIDIGAYMVEQGWAIADGRFKTAEAVARAAGRGIWRGTFVLPDAWRRTARSNQEQEDPDSGFWRWLFD